MRRIVNSVAFAVIVVAGLMIQPQPVAARGCCYSVCIKACVNLEAPWGWCHNYCNGACEACLA